MLSRFLFLLSLAVHATFSIADDPLEAKIALVQAGVKLTLVAEQPDVVTPTGIDVDQQGAVWVVASHTHFRPDDYQGPAHDEVVVLGADGERRVFYAQTDATMDLELGDDGWVYLAERDRILRVRDTDGDGVGDSEQTLATLETEGDYPHNGLAGLAWHPDGDLIFSLGENYWKAWTLHGAGDVTVGGTGEGGVFRCRADGRQLRRIAQGFWNPFGICVRQDGTIFAAENDPGSRPPCRLLHVVEGGDYGYQRLYGNAPHHPFVCWDGQLRGTLPMVHSLGEAPCGLAPLGNGLIVSSWTDNRIDFYPLEAKGASFDSHRVTLVTGSRDFRPTCITQASPTTFYFSDWVKGSYPIHGNGRVWKLEIDPAQAGWLGPLKLAQPNEQRILAERLRTGAGDVPNERLFDLAKGDDPFVARAAIDALSRRADTFTLQDAEQLSPNDRVTLLLAIRKARPQDEAWVRHFWNDENDEVRFEVLRWIADENLDSFRPHINKALASIADDYRLFEAYLATWNTLSGNPRAGVADPPMLMQRLRDEQASPSTRAFALRLIDPTVSALKTDLLNKLLAEGDEALFREVVHTLVARGSADARDRLLQIAQDSAISTTVRADAIAGLANPSGHELDALLHLATDRDREIREEALRSLRFAELNESQRTGLQSLSASFPQSEDLITAVLQPDAILAKRPEAADTAAWQARLADVSQPVDYEAGRRIFYHSSVGTCSKCHRRNGRGNVVGPDLTAATSLGEPESMLRSLLQPSRDVAPQYYPRALVTEDGRTFVGILLRDGGGGKEFYRDNTGRERSFPTSEIAMRKELTTSMMPDGLVETMTDREMRDLLAFLSRPPH